MVRLDLDLDLPLPMEALALQPRPGELAAELGWCEFKSLLAEIQAEAAQRPVSAGSSPAAQGELF